jgi:ferredoxin
VPRLEVEGAGAFDVEEGKRLVLAIEGDAGVDIMHQCGGYARCTTCRVEFLEGEPEMMTQAELAMLMMRNLLGEARLSCQVLCGRGMKVRVLMTVSPTGVRGPGWKPEKDITPKPFWVEKPDTQY